MGSLPVIGVTPVLVFGAWFATADGPSHPSPPANATVPPSTTSSLRQAPRPSLAQAMTRIHDRPTILATQQAAVARIQVSPATARKWLRRARAAAALPTVSAQVDLDHDRSVALDQEPGAADMLSNDLERTTGVRIRGTWNLDRLVFTVDELRAARAAQDMHAWRERLLLDVTRLYFTRKRALLALVLEPPASPAEHAEKLAAIEEMEATLRGLTGLSFARRWRQPRNSAPTTAAKSRPEADSVTIPPRARPRGPASKSTLRMRP